MDEKLFSLMTPHGSSFHNHCKWLYLCILRTLLLKLYRLSINTIITRVLSECKSCMCVFHSMLHVFRPRYFAGVAFLGRGSRLLKAAESRRRFKGSHFAPSTTVLDKFFLRFYILVVFSSAWNPV